MPSAPITVRPATREDLPWIDALHKKHSKQLGYATTKQFEGYIELGGLLVAEHASTGKPVGYVMFRDRYLKRDELGVIYQLCVDPTAQRGLIGATLLKEVFARSAYGCRLFCCWCAQDLPANRLWEAMGFVPIAFRGGSSKKKRVHIFWQKKIVAGDTETKWWYPSKTDGGQMREDRIALPIPPGLHWSEPMPTMVAKPTTEEPKLPKKRVVKAKATTPPPVVVAKKKMPLQFGPPPSDAAPVEVRPLEESSGTEAAPKVARPKSPPVDPKLIDQARELRDRYLEQVNHPANAGLLPSAGKYEVAKQLPGMSSSMVLEQAPRMRRLAA